jgi:hypothetical protein
MNTCLCCHKEIVQSSKFCSNKCQADYNHKSYIEQWKLGLVDGQRGVLTKNISAHIKRYLLQKTKGKCEICGWNRVHPQTGRPLLELDHIDGNSENNKEENLRLICPNCHSLTSNYKNLNNGKGRSWRTAKYLKNSYV